MQNTLSKESFNLFPHNGNPLISILSLLTIFAFFAIFANSWLLTGCSRQDTSPKIYQRTRFLMGTLVEIKLVSDAPAKADRAIAEAFETIRRIEVQMSAKMPGSWIEKISEEAIGTPLEVPEEIAEVIDLCLKYSRLTNGAFDISIGPVTKFWDFDKQMEGIPGTQDIKEVLPLVDFNRIHLDKERGTIELGLKGMSLDLGGAAKGYAVDKAVERLKEMGIIAGLINAGGDLKAFGIKPDGKLWNIGIQDPQDSGGIIGSIQFTNKAIVTSGDYERYIIYKGVKYHHILNPKTGWPAWGCKSVSVSCERALEADILSTAVFVLGPDEGMAFLEQLPQAEGAIIDSAGNISVTSRWKGLLKLEKRQKE